jgi:hypothetical protein
MVIYFKAKMLKLSTKITSIPAQNYTSNRNGSAIIDTKIKHMHIQYITYITDIPQLHGIIEVKYSQIQT